MKRPSIPADRASTSDFNKYLKWLERRELEITETLSQEVQQGPRILDFFPEFRDKLKAPFANSLDPVLEIPTLLPFYETLIVGISPFRDQHSFEKNYGLSISTMIELAEKGRLVFILNGYPKDYRDLVYLTALLREFTPPTVIRFRTGWDRIAAQGHLNEFKALGESLFKGKISRVPASTAYLKNTQSSIDKVERGAIAGFIELQIVGAGGAIEHIKNLGNDHPAEAAGLINSVYRPFYCDPIYGSLSGQHAMVRRPDYPKSYEKFLSSPVFFISEELGKALVNGLEVRAPRGVEIFKDVDIEYSEFRKALSALESAVNSLRVKEAIDQSEAIRRIWQRIDAMTKKEKRFQRLIQTVGAVGAYAARELGEPWLLKDLFPFLLGICLTPISEPLGKMVARFTIGSSLRVIFDLKKSIERPSG